MTVQNTGECVCVCVCECECVSVCVCVCVCAHACEHVRGCGHVCVVDSL